LKFNRYEDLAQHLSDNGIIVEVLSQLSDEYGDVNETCVENNISIVLTLVFQRMLRAIVSPAKGVHHLILTSPDHLFLRATSHATNNFK
jgi:hypothetical protein